MLYTKANFKELNYDIEGMDWETMLNSKSIEDNLCTLKMEYERLCEKHIPAKHVHEGDTRKLPWINYNVVKKARKHKKSNVANIQAKQAD